MNDAQLKRLIDRVKPLYKDPKVKHAFDAARQSGASVEQALIAALKDVAAERDALKQKIDDDREARRAQD